ncbi:MAG TPA: hypothetical protein VJU77_11095 [Chthoniobacterales bacterium]|nr:hypothetical protein [Chthoniobacterales bacterium]
MLWFQTAESVSIHTLAVAANDCYRAMGRHKGAAPTLVKKWFDGQTPPVQQALLYAQNFFKHGFKDLLGEARYSPLYGEMLILESASIHESLYGQMTPLMLSFTVRFIAENPHIVSRGTQNRVGEVIDSQLLQGINVMISRSLIGALFSGRSYR